MHLKTKQYAYIIFMQQISRHDYKHGDILNYINKLLEIKKFRSIEMVEIELKFQLPESKKKSVLQALKPKTAEKIRLQAKYYDTPDRLLAKNHVALRLRLEGDHWVQTFKAAGKNHLERLESEIHLGKCEIEPELDLSLFENNKTVKDRLEKVLGDHKDELGFQFKTDVERTFRVFQVEDTAIEVCLDDGVVSTVDQSEKICEVEFELKSGSAEQLILFTQEWVKKYQLWLDVRSKAQRGNLLVAQQKTSPAIKASTLLINKKSTTDSALRQMIANTLQHLLPNAAFIAEGVAEPEHIHQARVAIRRLRSALKIFGSWSSETNDRWETQLAEIFRMLGDSRDIDAIREDVLPQLVADGAPFCELIVKQTSKENKQTLFIKPEHTCLLLQLLAFTYHNPENLDQKKTQLKKKISKTLTPMHKKLIENANNFKKLSIEERHRTRKRAKRLRYSIEFISSLYDTEITASYLNELQCVQEKLGQYNDLHIAEQFFEKNSDQHPEYWFAVGWSKAKQKHLIEQSAQALQQFALVKPFW